MTRFDIDRWIEGWRGPALAALLTVVAALPGLLLLPPLDRDESRYAQATSQMLESGDYVDIRYQDQPRWKKPVGIYWMQAAAVAVTSKVENRDIAPYRLPSLLGAALAAAAAAWAGAALLGRRGGFAAGLLLGTTFLLSSEAGIAKTDAMLCGAVTLAMAGLARLYVDFRQGRPQRRPHKFLFWLGLGLSILIKGPIGLIVVAPAMVALSIWDRDARWMRRLGWGWGLPLVALIVGPWALAITIVTDGGFWKEAIGGDLAPKIAGAHESHGGFIGMYLALSPLLLFPATLLLPAAAIMAWRRRAEPAIRFFVCWVVPAWLVFEFAPTKLWHYTLPTFGGIALLMAAALATPQGRPARFAGAVLSGWAGVLIAAVAVYGASQFGAGAGVWTAAILTALLALAAGLGGAALLARRHTRRAVATAVLLGVAAHATLAVTLAGLTSLSPAPGLVREMRRAGLAPSQGHVPGPVAITTFHEPSFVFLTGRDTELTDGPGAARALSQGRPAWVEAHDGVAFHQAATGLGFKPRPVGRFQGHDYSSGDDVDLTLFAPVSKPVSTTAPAPELRR